jgi:hypothetical protein
MGGSKWVKCSRFKPMKNVEDEVDIVISTFFKL